MKLIDRSRKNPHCDLLTFSFVISVVSSINRLVTAPQEFLLREGSRVPSVVVCLPFVASRRMGFLFSSPSPVHRWRSLPHVELLSTRKPANEHAWNPRVIVLMIAWWRVSFIYGTIIARSRVSLSVLSLVRGVYCRRYLFLQGVFGNPHSLGTFG